MAREKALQTTAALDEQGRIAGDLACRECAYNLRSLELDGVCPECGTSVAGSARGHYLQFASPLWVKKLSRGALLLVIALAASVVAGIATWAVSFALAMVAVPSTLPASPPTGLLAALIAIGAVQVAVAVVAIVGLVYLTVRDPAGRTLGEGRSARRVVRVCLCLSPAPILGILVAAGMKQIPGALPLAIVVNVVMAFAMAVALLVLPLALLRHVIALMRRIPRPGLVTYAKIEFWGLLVVGVLMVFGIATIALAGVGMTRSITATTAPASAPASGSSYGAAQVTLTSVGPSGSVTTTTMPAFASAPFPGPAFLIGGALAGLGYCGGLGLAVAAFVLLVLVQRALSEAARQAANNELVELARRSGPE
jgi:hypothetical protein